MTFDLLMFSRYQSSVNRTVINMTGGIGNADNNDFRILPRFRTPSRNTSDAHLRVIKKRNKIIHNRIPNRISKEKIKLQKDLIEQQLLDLKAEKTKLYLENEDLKIRCSSLEEENQCLRLQLQKPQSCFQDVKNNLLEGIFKHASFVNIPQQKDWVLPQIVTVLMITLGELISSIQLKQMIPFHFPEILPVPSQWIKSLIPQAAMMKQMYLSYLYQKT
ncbi:uncharacterized protein TNCT_53631 [Trichonephila clavata]|uniref:BZIP domain-containing protein n=1 Tax=Trichonephila clavata TaxID=2740835 RepID=A0A8X6M2H3_TRICU|nr:uncharacterized protein TNCT_53631 [Trichonephila clavata]